MSDRDFSADRMTVAGYEFELDGNTVLVVVPSRADAPYEQQRQAMRMMAARWNACTDALNALNHPQELHHTFQSQLEEVRKILTSAVNAQGPADDVTPYEAWAQPIRDSIRDSVTGSRRCPAHCRSASPGTTV